MGDFWDLGGIQFLQRITKVYSGILGTTYNTLPFHSNSNQSNPGLSNTIPCLLFYHKHLIPIVNKTTIDTKTPVLLRKVQ